MGTKTVLVVEDEPALVSIYQRALERRGYNVLTANCGEEALEILDGRDGAVDLLLSDIVMPRMGGRELVWRLQQTHPSIRIILASGYADQDGALQMMEDLGVVYIAKPVDLHVLLDLVRDTIGDAEG